jgi:hypothetical protein
MNTFFIAAIAILTVIGWMAPSVQNVTSGLSAVLAIIYVIAAASEKKQLESLTTVDSSSGFLNARGAVISIERECALALNGKHSLCVVTMNVCVGVASATDMTLTEMVARTLTLTDIAVHAGEGKFAIIIRDRTQIEVSQITGDLRLALGRLYRASGESQIPSEIPARVEANFYEGGPPSSYANYIGQLMLQPPPSSFEMYA